MGLCRRPLCSMAAAAGGNGICIRRGNRAHGELLLPSGSCAVIICCRGAKKLSKVDRHAAKTRRRSGYRAPESGRARALGMLQRDERGLLRMSRGSVGPPWPWLLFMWPCYSLAICAVSAQRCRRDGVATVRRGRAANRFARERKAAAAAKQAANGTSAPAAWSARPPGWNRAGGPA